MLKKIQHLWNNILKKKKITNSINLYSIKNNFNFTNAISSTLVFFITSIKKLKLKNIKIIDKTQFLFNYYRLIFVTLIFIIFSLLIFLFFLF